MAQQQTPILDLDTLTDRPKLRINGKMYEMRTSDEFAYVVWRRQQRKFQQLGALMRKKRPTQADEKAQSRLLDEFVRQLVIAPDAVHASLRDTHRLEIVTSFSRRLRETSRLAAGRNGQQMTALKRPGKK